MSFLADPRFGTPRCQWLDADLHARRPGAPDRHPPELARKPAETAQGASLRERVRRAGVP